MNISLVIVAFNDEKTLGSCVRSARAAGFEGPIVVVDNASDDNTWLEARHVADELDNVIAVRAETNRGYAAGFNRGLESVGTSLVAVSNADCVYEGDWLVRCADFLADHPEVAACSPTVALANGVALNAEGLRLHKAGFGFNRHLGTSVSDAATEPSRVDGVQGTAFAIRTGALEAIGGWSESGFLYHEDVELSWALTSIGQEIWHVPTPPVVHDYHLTMSPEKFFLLERNRLELLGAYLSVGTRIVLSPLILATEVAVWLYAARQGSGLAGAKWRAYGSVRKRRALRRDRRRAIGAFRTVGDRRLLSRMPIAYPRNQTRALLSEAPSTGRRGGREMPSG